MQAEAQSRQGVRVFWLRKSTGTATRTSFGFELRAKHRKGEIAEGSGFHIPGVGNAVPGSTVSKQERAVPRETSHSTSRDKENRAAEANRYR